MAIGWYIVPYKRKEGDSRPFRYCEIDDHTAAIRADGGDWREVEILGNRAVVKVRASASTLQTLNGIFKRLPKDAFTTSLSDLTNPQKNALRNELQDQGYTLSEIQARFGNDLGQYTLGDVLRFMASRRLKPHYDADLDEIILDGEEQTCGSVDTLNGTVT